MFNSKNQRTGNIVITSVMILLAPAAWSATYYASPTGSAEADCSADSPGTLALAVSKATQDGDIVRLAAGEYVHTNASLVLDVAGITVEGASADASKTVIMGPGDEKKFTGIVVKKAAVVKNLTISGFYASGGASAVAGDNNKATKADALTAVNCRIVGNVSTRPAVYGGTWTNCFFAANTNSSGAGGAAYNGTYYDCVFTNNHANTYAGAVVSAALAERCTFVCNAGVNHEGGGAVRGGVFRNCIFNANKSQTGGAGAYGTYYDCFFTNNTATRATANGGGALYYGTASNCVFIANISKYNGGAVCSSTCHDCRFEANNSSVDGGAASGGTMTRCEFLRNTGRNGGAMNAGTSRACMFIGNKAGSSAGAGYGGTYYDGFFTNNVSQSSGHGGGGALTSATASNCVFSANVSKYHAGACLKGRYFDCRFEGNSAGYEGGAIYQALAVGCRIENNHGRQGSGSYDSVATNCVYSGNSPNSYFSDVGVAAYFGRAVNCLFIGNDSLTKNQSIVSSVKCVNCTIAGNKTSSSQGGIRGGWSLNTIIVDNTRDIVSGAHTNALYAVLSGEAALADCVQVENAKFNEDRDPSLPYYYLRQGSPARNAGIDVGWTDESLDLRGGKRLVGAVDLGCYEYQPVGFSFIVR